MKRKALMVFLLLLCLTIFPLSVNADTVSMYFTGTSGNIAYDIVKGGYWYIDPYYATVGGVPNTTIWCVDDKHQIPVNPWTANVTAVTAVSSGDNTYLQKQNIYKEMVWLINQYNSQDLENMRAIQWVIWDLSLGNTSHGGSYPGYNNWATVYSSWLTQAQASIGSISYSGWNILTDVNKVDQEFMVYVPEPSTLLLLGGGLIGLWGIRRKFRK